MNIIRHCCNDFYVIWQKGKYLRWAWPNQLRDGFWWPGILQHQYGELPIGRSGLLELRAVPRQQAAWKQGPQSHNTRNWILPITYMNLEKVSKPWEYTALFCNILIILPKNVLVDCIQNEGHWFIITELFVPQSFKRKGMSARLNEQGNKISLDLVKKG